MSILRRFKGLDKIRVIEVSPELHLGAEAREACARLGEHPGFQYLLQQLRRHKGAIRLAFENCEEKDLIRLQEKLKAVCWLERFVAHEAKIKAIPKKEVSLSEREREVLANSLASVEVLQ